MFKCLFFSEMRCCLSVCILGGSGPSVRAIHGFLGALVSSRPWHCNQRHGRGWRPLCVGCKNTSQWTRPVRGTTDPPWGSIHCTGQCDRKHSLCLFTFSVFACLAYLTGLLAICHVAWFSLFLVYLLSCLKFWYRYSLFSCMNIYISCFYEFISHPPYISTLISSPPGPVPSKPRNQTWQTQVCSSFWSHLQYTCQCPSVYTPRMGYFYQTPKKGPPQRTMAIIPPHAWRPAAK